IFMLKKAKEFMNEIGASFIITGEVLGQRPMSQNIKAMKIIEKESGLEGLIVRPLSAKLLPESIPEKQGWVKRDSLLDIVGRSRKKQFNLAREFDISDYACPAGGCLLTDPYFSLIIKDLLRSDMLNIDNINLVKNGRYHRITDSLKLIVGRNQEENQILMSLSKERDLIIEPESKGPIAIGRGEIK
ncbi:MAG: tRNA 4-thiouridine(8) synthase ThiI, partial [Elusimicrobiota bacterium]|nr:tRNA 4-thiouridine(8) synthase ThiI [Elusimicrobiota bacterium]